MRGRESYNAPVSDPAPTPAAELGAKLRFAFDLVETGVEMMRCNLRRAHPTADEARIQELVNEWLLQRPAADEDGGPASVFRVRQPLA